MISGLRLVRDDDADSLCALIGGVFAEYPGCVLDLAGYDAELLTMASVVAARGGEMWVVERGGTGGIELWSDSRFVDAHRLYETLGYRRPPETRQLDDLSNSVECCFVKTL